MCHCSLLSSDCLCVLNLSCHVFISTQTLTSLYLSSVVDWSVFLCVIALTHSPSPLLSSDCMCVPKLTHHVLSLHQHTSPSLLSSYPSSVGVLFSCSVITAVSPSPLLSSGCLWLRSRCWGSLSSQIIGNPSVF